MAIGNLTSLSQSSSSHALVHSVFFFQFVTTSVVCALLVVSPRDPGVMSYGLPCCWVPWNTLSPAHSLVSFKCGIVMRPSVSSSELLGDRSLAVTSCHVARSVFLLWFLSCDIRVS